MYQSRLKPSQPLRLPPPTAIAASSHVDSLKSEIAARPSHYGQFLLQLQRQYGNRYVQQVIQGRETVHSHKPLPVMKPQVSSNHQIFRQVQPQATELEEVAQTLTNAVPLLRDAVPLLGTGGQRELLEQMNEILSIFFPTGFGIINQQGDRTRGSERHMTIRTIRRPGDAISMVFGYETRLFLSYEASESAAGRHIPMGNWGSQILLYIPRLLGRTVNEVAGLLIHEMVHLMASMRESMEARFGAEAAEYLPTRAASRLLDVSMFADHRRLMEGHFSVLIRFLNRQPHRRFGALPVETATRWSNLLVEEVLGYIYRDRVTTAVARVEARREAQATGQRGGVAIATAFDPIQFLRNYVRDHWLSDPDDRTALTQPDAQQILEGMRTDLLNLEHAIQSRVGS